MLSDNETVSSPKLYSDQLNQISSPLTKSVPIHLEYELVYETQNWFIYQVLDFMEVLYTGGVLVAQLPD